MASVKINVDIAFDVIQCHECGVRYGIDTDFRERLRQSHEAFYCPNGHAAHYPAKNDVEVLREQLAAAEAARIAAVKRKEWAEQNAKRAEEERDAERAKHQKLRQRVAKGVCPCCKRTVAQLAKHMETKHPTFPRPESTS